jgi:two-component system nitrogen regulation sensor histidine kinase NtrY
MPARFDRRLISQALTNIVKNASEAIAAVPQTVRGRGRIRVSAAREGEFVVIDVIDNGIGLPKENRNRLLEPYVTTREKGTGLGLAIVARIIEQHGGTVELIDAEPDANGRVGACFTFTLPLRAADADPTSQPEAKTEEGAAAPTSQGQEEPPVMAVEKT